jgi:hypothetical protein
MRQRDRQTERQTDRQTVRQKERETVRQTERHREGHIVNHIPASNCHNCQTIQFKRVHVENREGIYWKRPTLF